MNMGGIDSSRIEAMMAQLKAAATRPAASPVAAPGPAAAPKADFAQALKTSLQQVSAAQESADQMGQRVAMGDDTVSLPEMMIAMQKANISFQTTVQVRNRLVSAYHEIMNMQV
ncbi:flagellar hook-basal body complex protein FliE [Massilia solisilvae]|uniref:Flagellar hook-basal body complex protein FliE n=1 Tax=Massilia solisilvae TaxID=1811225 RepID=A0ABT2BEV4_9BURK|nr:flagellar hook-basal body complex protein FliE [Massilia solisilvae]MCS0607046.1 flagellar hook-basal body complex protein FliE [Massilia solisilvae]